MAYNVKNSVFSAKATQFYATSAQSAGVLASSSATKCLLRPIIDILEDFWFYGYHTVPYPDFVQTFATQVDLLNELRIKPSFMNY